MTKTATLIVFLMLSAAAFAAESTRADAKPTWRWTLEERLAARFNPVLAKERAALAQYETAEPDDREKTQASSLYTIDGSRNPELFLPSELFESLLNGFENDAAFRKASRERLRDGMQTFGFEPDRFWIDLGRVTEKYRSLNARRIAQIERMQTASAQERRELQRDMEAQGRDLCRARSNALAAARRSFGEETFDRFLYTVVAPGLCISSDPDTPEHVRFLEGGCQ
jgi:hypothetical protein